MRYKIILIIILSLTLKVYSQDNQILEFNNKPVKDVLTVLASLNEINIIFDNTVKGNCSYYFTTNDLNKALTLFLKNQNLYIEKMDSVYIVSKIHTNIDENSNISINCFDSDIKEIIDRLSTITGKTILYDKLPEDLITLNIKDLKLEIILEIITKKIPDFITEIYNEYIYIKKETLIINNELLESTNGITVDSNNMYSINLSKVRFSTVLKELFNKSSLEYSIQGRNDNIIDNLKYDNKTFDEILYLILESGNCDYVISNGIYYIFDITKIEIENRHIDTQIIKLKNIKISEFLKLVPGSFMSNNIIKTDESSNSIIVYGTKIKTTPIIEFIKLVDIKKDVTPRWIKMNFIKSQLFKSILLNDHDQSLMIDVDENSFLILLNDNEFERVLELKDKIDIPPKSHKITLKFIKSEILLKNLPKSIDTETISVTDNPSVIFFYGEDDAYLNLINILKEIDKPVPQIKYKILVLQNTLGENKNLGFNINSHSQNNGDITLPENEWSAFSGALGSLMNLNFNVLSAFGPLFSFELNASIQENKTKVLVDTTLQGLSGQEVNFRNTTTSRFYQSTTDVDGISENGATQEVSWGIILDINGWASGDGMVTVNVKSTISDETTVSGESSGIPSTSEKIVNTEVRTPEGVPVIIGGLLSSKKEISKDKTPILGDIPLLGLLFSNDIELETRSEFIIYLIPYIEENIEITLDDKFKKAYMEFYSEH